MRQRVVIAIAMANDPDVIIADEPTTALDVTVQAQVLEALETARAETGAALVLITHDLGVIAGHADRVAVMYAGKLVETGTVDEIFYSPRMPYTLGLLGSLPRIDDAGRQRLTPIPGAPPSLLQPAAGLPVRTRAARCAREPVRRGGAGAAPTDAAGPPAPPATSADELDRRQAPSDVFDDRRRRHRRPGPARPTRPPTDAPARQDTDRRTPRTGTTRWPAGRPDPARSADLVKHFPVRSRGVVRRQVGDVHAVCGVSFDLHRGRDARPGRRVRLRQDHDRPRCCSNLEPATAGRGPLRRAATSPR